MPIYQERFFDVRYRGDPNLQIKAIGLVQNDSNYAITREGSPTIVIGYLLEGMLHITQGEQHYAVLAKHSFLLPHQSSYTIAADQNAPPKILWMNITGALPSFLVTQLLQGVFPIIGRCDVTPQIQKIIANSNPSEAALLQANVEITKAISDIKLHLVRPQVSQRITEPTELEQYILNGIQQAFSMEQMAAAFHVSPATLNRMFKAQFDTTPYRYYCEVRHSIAKSLLKNSALGIEEIALRLHYSDRNHFTTSFFKLEQQSPVKYRKAKQAKGG